MFAPKSYTVRKYDLAYVRDHDFNISIEQNEESIFYVQEQDNMLFRQIRLVTGDSDNFNKYIIFISIKSGDNKQQEYTTQLVNDGVIINGQRFVMLPGRSASMTRQSILSLVDETIFDELDERVSLGIDIGETVLSKYYAYKGLMLSSCHCIEDWRPKIVVVPDYYRTIPQQTIKHLYDRKGIYTDADGNERQYTQKDIKETTRDIEINVFDGCGIHHPSITQAVMEKLGCESPPTSILWRAPYIKGMTHEVDYVSFFAERGVSKIKDVWGCSHGVTIEDPPMIIITESMYKGIKYLKQSGTVQDWNLYWERFSKYDHCIGVAKWNFSLEEEPLYTRCNYQVLQDLKLEYDDFKQIADETLRWMGKIIDGDPLHIYCFLGLFADKFKPLNDYTRAILKNPEMLKEYGVREYLINLANKKRQEMKCGKLWVKGCFKFLVPDLVMMLEHIGGLEPNGCLGADEFFSQNRQGIIEGETVIERNPHICHSEHTILTGVDNQLRQKYCPNLVNVCMVNGKSLVAQRLQGADYDGDLTLVIQNEVIKSGVDRNTTIVMDIEDKITAKQELDTPENRLEVILRSKTNLIGENSNYASAYHNKMPHTPEQKKKYEKYIDIISVVTGKSIDHAKTGVLYLVPKNIAKYGRPLPYFMGYRSQYYKKQKLSRSGSNMNRLCWDIEKWERQFRWKRTFRDFDHTIMIDYNHLANGVVFQKIEDIYLRYCKELAQLRKDEREIQKENPGFQLNWAYYFDQYRKECKAVCPSTKMLANTAVKLCYEKYPTKDKKFIWRVAGDGVIENLQQIDIELPLRRHDGEFEYLGERYTFAIPVI